jgi:hypothetical protein
MTNLRALLVGAVCLVVGLVIGGMWRPDIAQAQVSRFRTERQAELLFIRYGSMTGEQCYLGMDGAGIISVPCDRPDR